MTNPTQNPPPGPVDTEPIPNAVAPSPAPKRGVPAAAVAALVLISGGAAYFVGRGTSAAPPAVSQETPAPEEGAKEESAGGVITLTPEAEKTAGIRTVTVRAAALADALTVPGVVAVTPDRGATVTPPVSGRVIGLYAQPGDRVAAGQLLARLDSPEVAQAHAAVREAEARVAEAKAAVQTAEAGVEQARTKSGSAKAALSRQRELAASGQIAQPSLQAAQNELTDAQAALQESNAALALAQTVTTRAQRLFDAEIASRAELDQAKTAQEQANAQSVRAKRRVEVAQAALSREQKVYGSGLLNRQAVQGAEAELRSTQGDIRQAEKQVQAARTALSGAMTAQSGALASLRAVEGSGHAEGGAGRIALYAPIAGTVAERRTSMGQAVERSSEMFTVQNLSAVSVVANVPEANAGSVRVGSMVSVRVAAFPKNTFTGMVQSVGSAVDEKTRALPVRCLVRNPGGVLKPEMFARVSLAVGTKSNTLAVPDAAVDEDGEKHFVYVAVKDGYEKRSVTVGSNISGMTEITDGIKAGERVVTDGMFVLKSESKKDELKEED